jgi:hypothetical protein
MSGARPKSGPGRLEVPWSVQPRVSLRRRKHVVLAKGSISIGTPVWTVVLIGLETFGLATSPSQAQSDAWQTLTVAEQVDISFLVYRYGAGDNAGVVIKLTNRNQSTVTYRFRAVFKSGDRESTSEPVTGVLQPFEVKTGELSGLWWIPFRDGSPITEVGLKGLHISRRSIDESRNGTDGTSS